MEAREERGYELKRKTEAAETGIRRLKKGEKEQEVSKE